MLSNRYVTLTEAAVKLEIDESELLLRIEKGIISAKRKDSGWQISADTVRELKLFLIHHRSQDYKVCYSTSADTFQDPREIDFYIVEGTPEPQAVMRQINRDICRRLILKGTEKILEVGCGCGLQALMSLKDKVLSYVGVDFSYNMIRKARTFLPNELFSVADAGNIPFKAGTFDRILCYSVFQHFPDTAYAHDAVSELIRVCKPGGLILIGDILSKDSQEHKKNAFWYLLKRCRYYKWLFYQIILNTKKFLRLKEDNNEKFWREFCHIREAAFSYDFFLQFRQAYNCDVEIFKVPHPIVSSYKRCTFEVRIRKH